MKKRRAALALGLCLAVGLCGAGLTACGGDDDPKETKTGAKSDYYLIGSFTGTEIATSADWGSFHGNPKDVPNGASLKTTKKKDVYELKLTLFEGNEFKIIKCSEYKKYEEAMKDWKEGDPEISKDTYAWTGAVTAENLVVHDDSTTDDLYDPDPLGDSMGGDNITVRKSGQYVLTLDKTSGVQLKYENVGEAGDPIWEGDVYVWGNFGGGDDWSASENINTAKVDKNNKVITGNIDLKASMQFGFKVTYSSAWGGKDIMSWAAGVEEGDQHIGFTGGNATVDENGEGTYNVTITFSDNGGFESIVFNSFTEKPAEAEAEA